MSADDVVTARRHELIRAFTALDRGRGWRMRHVSAFTAHALYRRDGVVAHVVGCGHGVWWWALQPEPKRLGPMARAADVDAACFSAHAAVYRTLGQQGRVRSA